MTALDLIHSLRLPFTRLTALSRQERQPAQYVQVENLVLYLQVKFLPRP